MEKSVLRTLTETIRQQAEKISFKLRERKKADFSKKRISLKTFFWTPREKLVLTTLTETIRQQAEKFSFNVQERKKVGYSKKKNSLKTFFWTLSPNGVLTTLAKNYCGVTVIFQLILRKRSRESFSSKNTFPEKSSGQVKCSFDYAVVNILPEVRKTLRQCMKKKKKFFFQANLFFVYAPMVNRMHF